MNVDTPVSSLFEPNATNIVIDNNSGNYLTFLDSIEKSNSYNWFHVKNAYHKNKQAHHEDLNFYYFDSLTQLSTSNVFKGLIVNTNHFKVIRDVNQNFPELKYWTQNQSVDTKIKVVQLKVIHGKKVGRTLGIPTGILKSQFRSANKFSGR